MDLSNHKYFQPSSLLSSPSPHGELGLESSKFFPDPLCKLNLKETSEFVKSFPMMSNNGGSSSAQRWRQEQEQTTTITNRRLETPSTPGRPVFCFSSVGNLSRKSFPSKWDDAQKWLISTTTHDSPAHNTVLKVSETSSKIHIRRQCDDGDGDDDDDFKKHITEEKVSKAVPSFHGSLSLDHHNTDIMLKDKFTDNTQRYSEPTKEAFVFRNHGSEEEGMKDACTEVVQHRDVGTEMTPLGSSTTSRCHTPFKSSSPARHNTPASRSGPLAPPNPNETSSFTTIDVIQLEECHFAKLQLGTKYDSVTSNWSSREEEEEEISKSLRHNPSRKGDSDCRASTWEEEEKTKCCFRYQREEAKIQAWVNLQNAKAEAQSRKLEVKIQKMKSNLEEKLMKKMALVHRKAEEWKETARKQHLEQIQKATEQAHKIMNRHSHSHSHNPNFSNQTSCGCFPCNNTLH